MLASKTTGYAIYLHVGFQSRAFRESGASREFNNTRKYWPPIRTYECDLSYSSSIAIVSSFAINVICRPNVANKLGLVKSIPYAVYASVGSQHARYCSSKMFHWETIGRYLPYTLYSDSALLVLKETSLNCNNILLALNWRYHNSLINIHFISLLLADFPCKYCYKSTKCLSEVYRKTNQHFTRGWRK